MNEIGSPLQGTRALLAQNRTAFQDRYAEQYAQTLVWLDRALADSARARDAARRTDAGWLEERRSLLAERTGVARLDGDATEVTISAQTAGASLYAITTESELLYGGLVAEPRSTAVRGVGVVAGRSSAETAQLTERYRAHGLRVVAPCFARPQHSFADDPERHWFHFTDDELLHLYFFVVGGSLAGLETAELLTTLRSFGHGPDGRPLPVFLDMRGRHTLTAAVAAALAPDAVDLLVLHDEVALLDHLEADLRVNTVWGFHTAFDALTLLSLASRTKLLFVEQTPTPSASFARAHSWLGPRDDDAASRSVERLVLAEPEFDALIAAVAARIVAATPPASREPPPAAPLAGSRNETEEQLYRRAVAGKLAFLEAEHVKARRRREQRYDVASLTPDQYRARVAESLTRVMGPALPRAEASAACTRLVERRDNHDLYEVVLESVAGVEVAGYLLLPPGPTAAPAVICQHGRGGRPEALVGPISGLEGQWIYDRFAQRLAEKGYVTFVPFMNWGWGRTPARDALVKPAYALGITPNRFEAAQLHTVVDFLVSRPEVIGDRVGFYGLSYGGHAALWLGACEPRLAAVVTAGYFNDLQTKLFSTEIPPSRDRPTSFITVDEGYDMFAYNVFNELCHAEMATRFAPRPYMVENGLRDGATPTAWVEREFARVQAVYDWLDRPGAVQLAHFDGPHRVWAEESFQFLHRHLHARR